MSDLVEFLRARLDEDEQAARASAAANPGAAATHWSAEQVDYTSSTGLRGKAWAVVPERVEGATIAISPTEVQPRFVTHIARHDPARVLAEVTAKRKLIEEHAPNRYGECRICGGPDSCGCMSGVDHPCDTLRLLAQIYDWHEDYDKAWRP